MEQTTLISVIVPVYNVEDYLARCVDSILAQTYRNLEVILVEDGTRDSCGAICDAYALQDPRVRVIHKENGGLSSARNAGIDIARGEYLGFVDSDDWIEPEMYETMLALAQKHHVKLVCAGRYDFSSRTGQKTLGLCPEREEVISAMEMLKKTFLWDHCDSAAWDKLYHRSLFREIRYPVGMVNEDVAIFYLLAEEFDRAALCPVPVYNYYHRPGSITYAAISPKIFHQTQHTAKILPYIRQHHPELEGAARYQRVHSLAYVVQCVDLAREEDRQKFRQECAAHRAQLREHLAFLLTSPFFTARERLTDVLLALNLYRPLRQVINKVRP